MEPAESPGMPASSADEELASQSNEQLLQRLTQSVEMRRRHRNKQKVVYGGYFLVCGVVGILLAFAPLFDVARPFPLAMHLSFLVFAVAFMGFVNWYNRSFYRRTAQQRDTVVQELARRGEERALGPLLELMDMRMSVSSKNWGPSRAVFIESLERLLNNLAPAAFSDLSDAQIHQLTPLLLLPEPELRHIIGGMLCRSGDTRALRALRKYENMYRVQRLQKFNPAMPVMLAWLRRRKMPTLDKEAIAEVKRCCGEIEPRVEAEKRMAQLLRASESGTEQPANQLLRGAMLGAVSVPAEQLLRPDTTPAMDNKHNEEPARNAAEIEIASAVNGSTLPETTYAQPQPTEDQEVKLIGN